MFLHRDVIWGGFVEFIRVFFIGRQPKAITSVLTAYT